MCVCTPSIRTPWCGAVGCKNPEQKALTYGASVDCSNCGEWRDLQIKMGTPITTYPCPNCGCATLKARRSITY